MRAQRQPSSSAALSEPSRVRPPRGLAVLAALLKSLPVLLVWGIVLAALAAPLLRMQGDPTSREIYGLLGGICHQLPTRSLFLGDARLGLCARCMALYGGMALSVALGLIARARPLPGWLLVAGLIPCLLDGLSANHGLWKSDMALKLISGAIAGSTIALFCHPRYCRMIDSLVFRLDRPTPRPLGDAP